MLVMLGIVGLCAVISAIPFVYPDTIMNTPGTWLNHLLGTALGTLGLEYGLVAGRDDLYGLTLRGVLVVYGVPLLVLLYLLRTR
jgi:hypothetical protein